jgi:hypothetical protein
MMLPGQQLDIRWSTSHAGGKNGAESVRHIYPVLSQLKDQGISRISVQSQWGL